MTASQPHVSTAWVNIASFDGPEEAERLMHVLRKDGMDGRARWCSHSSHRRQREQARQRRLGHGGGARHASCYFQGP